MRLRPYISAKDYQYVAKWMGDERTHSLWSADRIPYPMTEASLDDVLKREAEEWNGSAYVATEDDGGPVGFFVYSVNVENNEGFLRYIVVDSARKCYTKAGFTEQGIVRNAFTHKDESWGRCHMVVEKK